MELPSWLSLTLLVNRREERTFVELETTDRAPEPYWSVFSVQHGTGLWLNWNEYAASDPDLENASLMDISDPEKQALLSAIARDNPKLAAFLARSGFTVLA